MRISSAGFPKLFRAFIAFLLVPIWMWFIGPWFLRIPPNFSYTADVISTDNFYDSESAEFKGEQYSKSSFSYVVDSVSKNILTIRNTFKVETLDGKPVFQFSPVYAIDALSHKHVAGYSDIQREGYLFAPPGITPDKTFTYWSANNIKPGTMSFVNEENLYGLTVHKYATNYGGEIDQSVAHQQSQLPDSVGIKLNSINEIWIEPVTGYLVKQQDYSTDYYYYDKRTGEKLSPYNKFLNTYSEDSVQSHIRIAKRLKLIQLIVMQGIPLLLLLSAGIITALSLGYFSTIKNLVQKNGIPLVICTLLCTLTVLGYNQAKNSVDSHIKEEFDKQALNITSLIERRFDIYVHALIGAKALLKSSTTVTRSEWKRYVDTLDIQLQYPGVQGIGFSKIVPKEKKQQFIQSIRSEGFPDFDIKPQGDRDVYSAIMYLEPFDERNRRAFGYDMLSEQTRRITMNRAKESGKPTASGKVTLVQETDTNIQPGFLVYVPYYEGENATATTKNESVDGFVYSPFRMNDLMHGIFGDRNFDLDFTIYDGLKTINDSQLYKSTASQQSPRAIKQTIYKRSMTIPIASHVWTIVFENKPNFRTEQVDRKFPLFVLYGGFAISALITLLSIIILRSKDQAESYGRELTKNLLNREKELETKNTDLEKFRLAVEHASDQIVITNNCGTVLYINASASEITGFTQSEILGTKVGTLWGKLMEPDYYKTLWHTISVEKKSFIGEIKNRRKNGEIYTAELHITPVLNDSDDVVFYVGIERDITKQKAIDQMKSGFISLASHQLRTPLTALRWFLEILMDDKKNFTNQQVELVDKMYTSTKRMILLVSTLLNISRIESGRIAVTPKSTSLPLLIRSVIDEITPQYGHTHSFHLEIRDSISDVTLDTGLVRHIYLNLLTNACKYSPSASDIYIRVYTRGTDIVSEIEDHGYGIPQSQQHRIFERFFRGDNVAKIQTDGTGLGLYLAKLITNACGGTISFVSTEGHGTIFTFTIPKDGMKEKKGEVSLE